MIRPGETQAVDRSSLASQRESEGETSVRSTNFLTLGKRITGWTSNLLATAVVVMVVLTLSPQFIALWVPGESGLGSTRFADHPNWPALQSCSLEFGDSPFQLKRESFRGTESEVMAFLQNRCREELNGGDQPVGELGREEATMIQHSANREPIEQVEGQWRIFLGPQFGETGSLPMALGIRDNCPAETSEVTTFATVQSRLAVWGLAMPREAEEWTTFVATAATIHQTAELDDLLPPDAKRTLAMTDPFRESLIGFSGGEFDSAISYYRNLAKNRGWKLDSMPDQNGQAWTGRLSPNPESQIKSIQVRLTLDHNEKLTGILIVNSNQVKAREGLETNQNN